MQLTSLSLALSRIAGGGFSPLSLFAAGEQGAWYDPSDLATLYQDAAGTAPVTAVEQPVGLMLDKSGRGNHAFQATTSPAKRPILSARVNLLLATATLSTQSVTTQATSYKLYFAGTGSITLSGTATGTYSAGSNAITCTAGTLTLTVSGSVLTADLRPSNIGNNIPAYQRVNTATDYDTAGFPYYLKADGTYTSMSTNSIDFSATDKITTVTGFRNSNNLNYPLIELSATSSTNPGSFLISSGSVVNGGTRIGGQVAGSSSLGYDSPANFAAPISVIVSNAYNIAGTTTAERAGLKINGQVQSPTTGGAATTGTGNFGIYPLYLFARNNALWFFNGQFYGAIIRGATTSGSDLTNAESYMNTQSGGIY